MTFSTFFPLIKIKPRLDLGGNFHIHLGARGVGGGGGGDV